jgi:hypothetical protein
MITLLEHAYMKSELMCELKDLPLVTDAGSYRASVRSRQMYVMSTHRYTGDTRPTSRHSVIHTRSKSWGAAGRPVRIVHRPKGGFCPKSVE